MVLQPPTLHPQYLVPTPILRTQWEGQTLQNHGARHHLDMSPSKLQEAAL